jgi:N utilization substance protein B
MYQIGLVGTTARTVIAEMAQRPSPTGALDTAFLERLAEGALAHAEALDAAVSEVLREGWSLERLSLTMRGLLRVAAFEIRDCPDVPVRAAVSEYVTIAHSFFDEDEAGFVNGALETLARRLRAAEWADGGQGD